MSPPNYKSFEMYETFNYCVKYKESRDSQNDGRPIRKFSSNLPLGQTQNSRNASQNGLTGHTTPTHIVQKSLIVFPENVQRLEARGERFDELQDIECYLQSPRNQTSHMNEQEMIKLLSSNNDNDYTNQQMFTSNVKDSLNYSKT